MRRFPLALISSHPATCYGPRGLRYCRETCRLIHCDSVQCLRWRIKEKSQTSMFWIGGYTRLLTRLLAGLCLALSMLGSVVATERATAPQHGAVVASTVAPALELSDTAVCQAVYRLTQDNTHCKALASCTRLLCGTLSQFNDFGCLADRSVSSKCNSLFHLGTMLRL